MNHSDVPKGTTVLGVDIGGGTSDEAVKKLDDALGEPHERADQLSRRAASTVSSSPTSAGLQLDSEATVRDAAGSDYNPVSVIGSLFGGARGRPRDAGRRGEAPGRPGAALAGGSGSATDGTIKFEPGKAVAVYGKAGKGIDVDNGRRAGQDAYRARRSETGTTGPGEAAGHHQQPTVTKAEVDRRLKGFARPAMSGLSPSRRAPRTGSPFSPQKSLWKFLCGRSTASSSSATT